MQICVNMSAVVRANMFVVFAVVAAVICLLLHLIQ